MNRFDVVAIFWALVLTPLCFAFFIDRFPMAPHLGIAAIIGIVHAVMFLLGKSERQRILGTLDTIVVEKVNCLRTRRVELTRDGKLDVTRAIHSLSSYREFYFGTLARPYSSWAPVFVSENGERVFFGEYLESDEADWLVARLRDRLGLNGPLRQ